MNDINFESNDKDGIISFDNSNLYYKNDLLKLYRRMVMIWTDGTNTIQIKEPDDYIFVDLYRFHETWDQTKFKIRFLNQSKNICIFKHDAMVGDSAVLYFDYSGFVMV